MISYANYQELVNTLAMLEPDAYETRVRSVCRRMPDSVRDQFLEAAKTLSADALSFAYKYADYYIKTRSTKIIPTQLHFTMKYAIIVAPVVAAIFPEQRFNDDFVGNTVEYSFASVRISTQPDPAEYDPALLYGAVILRLLEDRDADKSVAMGIGASWETVVEHWEHLKDKSGPYAQAFVKNLNEGGSISLSGGLL